MLNEYMKQTIEIVFVFYMKLTWIVKPITKSEKLSRLHFQIKINYKYLNLYFSEEFCVQVIPFPIPFQYNTNIMLIF